MSVCGTQVCIVCICATCACLRVCAWLSLYVLWCLCEREEGGGGSCVGVTGCDNVHRSYVSWLIGQEIEGGIDRKGWEGKRCREDRVGGKEV